MSTQMAKIDFIVIGAGIAGISVAAELSASANVVLVEAEEQPGYHSTGRSAALFSEIYGNAAIRALSRASRSFLFEPDSGFCQTPLVRPRGTLFLATGDQMRRLTNYAALPDIAPVTRLITPSEMTALCPLLRDDYIAGGLIEPGSMDIEVHELQSAYLRAFRRHSRLLLTNAPVSAITPRRDGWTVTAGGEELTAPVVVNAAGAWADEIAAMAGLESIGLKPYRRTAALIDPPTGTRIDRWPALIDIDEQFYVKPDAGLLLLSPADETPSAPCDAQPEQLDVATAAYRAEAALALTVQRIKHSWAGLRNFVADRTPVVGHDPAVAGFFWLAGQGGYGIQTAPALARVAATLLLRQALPADLVAAGVDPKDLAPERLRSSGQTNAQPAG